MSNPFSRDYKPQLDTRDQARSVNQSRATSKRRSDALESPDPAVRHVARGTIPGVGTSAAEDWERAKVIRKPSGL